MKALLLVAACALAPLASLPEHEIVFEPVEGLTLTKTFVHSFDLELVDEEAEVLVDGEEQELEEDDLEFGIADEDTVVFVDEVVAVDEDVGVTRLRRTFQEITSLATYTYGEEVEEVEGASELEGLTVAFSWNEDDEAYDVAYDDEEGDEEGDEQLLEELVAPCDLTEFLPEDAVSEGDTWEPELEAFIRVSSPGGDLVILDEGETEDDDEFADQFDENLEGTITCEYRGTREEGDREVSVIFVEAALSTTIEVEADEEDLGDVEGEGSQRFTFSMKLEGELLWDREAGHAVSLELAGEAELEIATDQEMEAEGTTLEMHTVQTFEGELSIEATFE